MGINDAGVVTGSATIDASLHHRAFVWTQASGMQALAVPPGTVESFGTDINASGQVLGMIRLDIDPSPNSVVFTERAFVWTGGVPKNLGDLGDGPELPVVPGGINDRGEAVGAIQAEGFDTVRPFYWHAGAMVDLRDRILPGTDLTFETATAINNAGWIVGVAVAPSGVRHAVLLTPMERSIAR